MSPQQIVQLAQHLPCGRIKPLFDTPAAINSATSNTDDTASVHSDTLSVDGSTSSSSSSIPVAAVAVVRNLASVNVGWTGRDVCDGDVCTVIASATGSEQVLRYTVASIYTTYTKAVIGHVQ
jgi:hypothetical protein